MQLFSDIYYLFKGKFFKTKTAKYRFAFIIHSRGYKDIYRKYPLFKVFPKFVILFIMNNMWPVTLSKVTGVYSTKNKEAIEGYVIGITATSEYLTKNRVTALKKIRQAIYLAKGRGVSLIGLGGLTSSLSAGGKLLLDSDVNITTGHAYTAFNVTQNVIKITEMFGLSKEKITIAVVGSAGSVGSTSSLILARHGYEKILLIDLSRKSKNLLDLKNNIEKINRNVVVNISYNINDIKGSDIVITATNTPEALITTDKVEDGMVIIDDAQPSDVHADVLKMKNVLVIEAGVVHTPNINSNFNYGLKNKTDNFCCMAELLILASNDWKDHFVIERATLEHVDKISEMGKELGFQLASFQNFLESISQDKINHVKSILRKKHGI